MLKKTAAAAAFLILFVQPLPAAADQTPGRKTTYTSPGGVDEQCIILPHIPGGSYQPGDREQEQAYCAIDIYDADIALCPKIWSTSAGTIIYDLSAGSYAGKVKEFEQTACRNSKSLGRLPVTKLAKFKSTMNTRETSGTFATASLLYYHFSRYFDTLITVPVSVYRTIDRINHLQRVSRNGLRWSSRNRMLHAGWQTLVAAEENPASYHPQSELITEDGNAIHGVLLNSPGHRYNTSVNGTRASGWGSGQNYDFQKTAPYLALSSEKSLTEAAGEGLDSARRNKKMRHDLGRDISIPQMVFWMTELTEISLLDFIFNQQDRIGNIDYIPYWYWQEDGRLQRLQAHTTKAPPALADKNPLLLRRTQLNDNDAGGRIGYINYTKKTKMLEKQRHYRPETYTKLLKLNHDFSTQGQLYQYLRDSFALSEKQIDNIVRNTADATAILQKSCREGKLRFDLDPDLFLRTGQTANQSIDCEIRQ